MPHLQDRRPFATARVILSLGVSMWSPRSDVTRYAKMCAKTAGSLSQACAHRKTMGIAFDKMREALAGQAWWYVRR
jgi:hypothetical protein